MQVAAPIFLGVNATDSRRLQPYLPFGLILADEADALARVQGEFKRMLLAQRLHPGQKVPLDDIAESLGLSRTPVREAMRKLETEGLVSALQNRGFVVRRVGADETAHLVEARLCVEGHATAAALEQRTDAFIDELSALQETYARILAGSPVRRRLGMLADKAFHLRIAEQAGNPVLTELLANIFDRLIFTRPLEGFSVLRMPAAVAEHEAIVTAIRDGTRAQAREAVLRNIRNGGAAIISYLREMESARIAI
jgi:DNA-binding GntR family transcriptional regulator